MFLKRRDILKYTGIAGMGAVVAGSGSLFYMGTIEPAWLDVVSVNLHLSRLAPAFNGYRIVQLSDIHADMTWMDAGRLSYVVGAANAQNPDLIVITGDFVTYLYDGMADTLSVLKGLRARDGVFAVLGNHDHWSDANEVSTLIRAYGIQELNNRVHTIQRANTMLHLVGMDDLWVRPEDNYVPVWAHQTILTPLLQTLPAEGAALLLVHEPDFADVAAATGRIDVQLSGHTHGGQVRLPGRGALRLPYLGKRYQAGLYRVQTMWHYTSRGLGTVEPQVRFNCRPEITVFTCRAAG
ncbi:MAG: metallophosphoesterase [Chloroflexi bacterium]|nr:MAG: metallophosphoesterase [Chloroflexota bacterium]